MVRFEFDYPNLPRVSEAIDEMIKSASIDNHSSKTKLEFNSDNDSYLRISEDSDNIKRLNKASSESGNPITCKVKGIKKQIKTGNTTKTVEIDEISITTGNSEDIDQILEIINNE